MRDSFFRWSLVVLFAFVSGLFVVQLNAWDAHEQKLQIRLKTLESQEVVIRYWLDRNEFFKDVAATAKNLSEENKQLRDSIENAKTIVNTCQKETDSTKAALKHAVKMLQDQIDSNNQYLDYISKLEAFIDKLLVKIPKADQPIKPTM